MIARERERRSRLRPSVKSWRLFMKQTKINEQTKQNM